VVAVMLGLAVHGETFSFDQLTTFRWPRPSSISWEDFRRPLRWPLLFGVACTIYSLGWLALAILTRAYRLVRP
jgi:asparagine N-glycosylation enzyme membrane subunit Stt3